MADSSEVSVNIFNITQHINQKVNIYTSRLTPSVINVLKLIKPWYALGYSET